MTYGRWREGVVWYGTWNCMIMHSGICYDVEWECFVYSMVTRERLQSYRCTGQKDLINVL